ncbi:MAG: ASCH domain-containing protein [Clostridiales bacterium]|nr:ASCH domain-containing protein [Clostridiales bacterium]
MTYKAFYNKVIAMLPSGDLRAAVKASGHVFSETDLLKFIDGYAPSFGKKIELFDLAAEVFSDKKTKYHAKKLSEHCRKCYEYFASPSDEAVYVIQSHSSLDNDGRDVETLVVKTFDDAIVTVGALSRRDKKYLCEGEQYKYVIIKQPIICASTEHELRKKNELGRCEWNPKHGIVSISAWRLKNEFGVDCNTCKRKHDCLQSHEVNYPPFLQPYDLVAYKSYQAKPIAFNKYGYPEKYTDIAYGVLCCDMTRDDNNYSSYVIELDSKCVKERRADEKTEDGDYKIYFDHHHPQYAELYKPNRSDVPDNIYADYLYAAEELKKIDMLVSNITATGHLPDEDITQTHVLHLALQPYRLIESGQKTVEIRLYDEKRRMIKRDDTVIFLHGDCGDMIKVRVKGTRRFNTFVELMQSELFGKTGSQGYTPEQAAASMYKYYTPEQEKKYGVLAIEFELAGDEWLSDNFCFIEDALEMEDLLDKQDK